jgi:hypothetical protein
MFRSNIHATGPRRLRLWSLDPQYLDTRGLVALWRESLLAQAVLRGRTRGYTAHPQLERFRALAAPVGGIAEYLRIVHAEAARRGYRFAADKISRARAPQRIEVTSGQLELEWRHLLRKLEERDPERHARLVRVRSVRPHASFRVVPGGVADWERARG